MTYPSDIVISLITEINDLRAEVKLLRTGLPRQKVWIDAWRAVAEINGPTIAAKWADGALEDFDKRFREDK